MFTYVAYVKVTSTISKWIQSIVIETTSQCGLDLSRSERNPVASVDIVAAGSRSSCQCGQALSSRIL